MWCLPYVIAGIILFAIWPKASLELRTAYVLAFPLHAIVGCWIHACVSHRGKTFLDNPVWYGVLVVVLLLIIICGV